MRLFPLLLLASTGCVINSEQSPRPRDLSEAWQVDRTRILAVRAEPPEIAPGEATQMQALIATAFDEQPELNLIWLACEDGGDFELAATDLGALDLDNPDPVALAGGGIHRIRAWLPSKLRREPGRPRRFARRRAPGRCQRADPALRVSQRGPGGGHAEEIDFNEIEVGFKRVVVSEATTPNNNPRIAGFTVDGHRSCRRWFPPSSCPTANSTTSAWFSTMIWAIEEYLFVNSEGEVGGADRGTLRRLVLDLR